MIPSVRFWIKRKGVKILLIQLSWWITKQLSSVEAVSEKFRWVWPHKFIQWLLSWTPAPRLYMNCIFSPQLTSHAPVLFNHLCTYSANPIFSSLHSPIPNWWNTASNNSHRNQCKTSITDQVVSSIDVIRQGRLHHVAITSTVYIYTRPEPFLLCNTITLQIGTFQPIYISHLLLYTFCSFHLPYILLKTQQI